MHVYMNSYVRERFVFSGTFIRWNATMLMTFSKNFSFQKISTTRPQKCVSHYHTVFYAVVETVSIDHPSTTAKIRRISYLSPRYV